LTRSERPNARHVAFRFRRLRGPAFNASPWSTVTNTEVGTMTFTFSNGNTGVLTYTVDGVQVAKAIQRQVFSSPTTLCQ
jgi:hypothetical protein